MPSCSSIQRCEGSVRLSYLFSPVGTLADRAIYFACVNFVIFVAIARRTIISGSITGRFSRLRVRRSRYHSVRTEVEPVNCNNQRRLSRTTLNCTYSICVWNHVHMLETCNRTEIMFLRLSWNEFLQRSKFELNWTDKWDQWSQQHQDRFCNFLLVYIDVYLFVYNFQLFF